LSHTLAGAASANDGPKKGRGNGVLLTDVACRTAITFGGNRMAAAIRLGIVTF
jgi:hypothetical protein